eukprot:368748-Prymnesium_polylepis.1
MSTVPTSRKAGICARPYVEHHRMTSAASGAVWPVRPEDSSHAGGEGWCARAHDDDGPLLVEEAVPRAMDCTVERRCNAAGGRGGSGVDGCET